MELYIVDHTTRVSHHTIDMLFTPFVVDHTIYLVSHQQGTIIGADVHTPVRSDMLRDSRRVGTDVHTHERATYARRGKPPSWRGLRMRHESQGVKAFKCTHLNVKHTLAGASPAVVARSSDALRESRRVGADVHTHERGTYVRRGKPLLPSWRCPRTR